MRKYLLLFAFVANTTFAQNIQNIEKLSEFKDRFLENPFESIRLLKGNVKSFKQTYMKVENFNKFEIFSDSIPENNHARDKRIKINVVEKLFFELNNKKQIVEERYFDDTNTLTYKKQNQYDNAGNLIRRDVYEYDSISGEKYQTDLITYEYDTNGNILNIFEYNEQKQKLSKYPVNYDHKGNIVEIVLTNFVCNAEYDSKGNVSKTEIISTSTDSESEDLRVAVEYENTFPTIVSIYLGKELVSTITDIKFDDKGNILESTDIMAFFFNIKENTSYIYRYDTYNNWTKKEEYRDGLLHNITEREYEYY